MDEKNKNKSATEAPALKPVPPEIKQWNTGAFLLNWIWGIGNGAWLSLLCLIPIFGFAWMFVVGIKGNEWAWQNRNWDSVEAFQKTQKRWSIAGVCIFFSGIILFLSILFIPLYILENSTVSKKSFNIIQNSSQIQAIIGIPIKRVGITQGSVNTQGSGTGHSLLKYRIQGPEGNATVYVEGTRRLDEWDITYLVVKTGNGHTINFTDGAESSAPHPRNWPEH